MDDWGGEGLSIILTPKQPYQTGALRITIPPTARWMVHTSHRSSFSDRALCSFRLRHPYGLSIIVVELVVFVVAQV